MGLAGKNKPIKQDSSKEGSLRYLTLWPEEEWQNQKVFGKQIKTADMDSALLSLQTNAMQLQPGVAPNNEFWEDVLGLEKPAKAQGPGDAGKKAALPPSGRPAPQANVPSAGAQDLGDRARPSRGRKRHYDDNSFVGYGEGYADDDDDTGFYSNGEGTGKKKRKKVSLAVHSSQPCERCELTLPSSGSCLQSFDADVRARWQLRGRHVWHRCQIGPNPWVKKQFFTVFLFNCSLFFFFSQYMLHHGAGYTRLSVIGRRSGGGWEREVALVLPYSFSFYQFQRYFEMYLYLSF